MNQINDYDYNPSIQIILIPAMHPLVYWENKYDASCIRLKLFNEMTCFPEKIRRMEETLNYICKLKLMEAFNLIKTFNIPIGNLQDN